MDTGFRYQAVQAIQPPGLNESARLKNPPALDSKSRTIKKSKPKSAIWQKTLRQAKARHYQYHPNADELVTCHKSKIQKISPKPSRLPPMPRAESPGYGSLSPESDGGYSSLSGSPSSSRDNDFNPSPKPKTPDEPTPIELESSRSLHPDAAEEVMYTFDSTDQLQEMMDWMDSLYRQQSPMIYTPLSDDEPESDDFPTLARPRPDSEPDSESDTDSEPDSDRKEPMVVRLPLAQISAPIIQRQESSESLLSDDGYESMPPSPEYPPPVLEWVNSPVQYRPDWMSPLNKPDRPPAREQDSPLFLELKQLMDKSRNYELVDINSTSAAYYDRHHETRNAEIQWQLKNLVEELLPARNADEQLRNVMIKAEAAREMRFVRCDDWCYFWLTLWTRTRTESKQAFLMQLDLLQPQEEGKPHIQPNHYFLLIPPPEQDCAFHENKIMKLARSGEYKDSLMDKLATRGFMLVDPTMRSIMPATRENIRILVNMISARYGFRNTGDINLTCVEQFEKEEAVSRPESREAEKTAKSLVPIAALLAAREDPSQLRHLATRMKYLGLTPANTWPDKIRLDAPWNHSVIYCLSKLYPESHTIQKLLPSDKHPTDFDIIACFRADSPEYFKALKRQIIQYLKLGKSVDECLLRLQTHGFVGDHQDGKIKDNRNKPYKIPCLKGIPHQFRGTTEWDKVGVNSLRAMGINPEEYQPELKDLLIKFLNTTQEGSGYVVTHICENYRNSWLERDEIKDELKQKTIVTPALVRHLMYATKVYPPEHLADLKAFQWKPIDTLRCCKPNQTCYNSAMKKFLRQMISKGLNSRGIAEKLKKHDTSKQIHNADAGVLKIELPGQLKVLGYDTWTAEAVSALLEEYNIEELHPERMLVKQLTEVLDTEYEGKACTLLSRLETRAKRNPYLAQYTAQVYPKISQIKAGNNPSALLRFLIEKHLHLLPARIQSHLTELTYEFALKPTDKLVLNATGTTAWQNQLKKCIGRCLEDGHNLTYIATKLSRGDQMLRQGSLPKIPVPWSTEENPSYEWTYENLKKWLNSEGLSIDKLCSEYPAAEDNLATEYALYKSQRKHLSIFDGLLIDGMLNSSSFGDKGSRHRAANACRVLVKAQNNPEGREVSAPVIRQEYQRFRAILKERDKKAGKVRGSVKTIAPKEAAMPVKRKRPTALHGISEEFRTFKIPKKKSNEPHYSPITPTDPLDFMELKSERS